MLKASEWAHTLIRINKGLSLSFTKHADDCYNPLLMNTATNLF